MLGKQHLRKVMLGGDVVWQKSAGQQPVHGLTLETLEYKQAKLKAANQGGNLYFPMFFPDRLRDDYQNYLDRLTFVGKAIASLQTIDAMLIADVVENDMHFPMFFFDEKPPKEEFGYRDKLTFIANEPPEPDNVTDFVKEFQINAVDPAKDFTKEFKINVTDPKKDFIKEFKVNAVDSTKDFTKEFTVDVIETKDFTKQFTLQAILTKDFTKRFTVWSEPSGADVLVVYLEPDNVSGNPVCVYPFYGSGAITYLAVPFLYTGTAPVDRTVSAIVTALQNYHKVPLTGSDMTIKDNYLLQMNMKDHPVVKFVQKYNTKYVVLVPLINVMALQHFYWTLPLLTRPLPGAVDPSLPNGMLHVDNSLENYAPLPQVVQMYV